jgi:hypothetical protein
VGLFASAPTQVAGIRLVGEPARSRAVLACLSGLGWRLADDPRSMDAQIHRTEPEKATKAADFLAAQSKATNGLYKVARLAWHHDRSRIEKAKYCVGQG